MTQLMAAPRSSPRRGLAWVRCLALALAVVAAVWAAPGCARGIKVAPGGEQGQPPASSTARQPAESTLSVFSDPAGAEVVLAGRSLGTTPARGIRLGTAPYRVSLQIGELVWAEELPPSSGETHVVYVQGGEGRGGRAPEAGLRSCTVTTSPVGATIYVNGVEVGSAPLHLHVGSARTVTIVAYAEGSLPQRKYLWPEDRAGPAYSFNLYTPAEGRAGQAETPQAFAPTAATWTAAGHAVIDLAWEDAVLASPEGRLALISRSDTTQSVVVYDLAAGAGAPVNGRPVASFWTGTLAKENDESLYTDGVSFVDWVGEKLLVLAPEPASEGESPGRLGLSLWEAHVGGRRPRRLGWLPTWCVGQRLEDAWVTSDRRAAVVHTWDLDCFGYFYVLDLRTGEEEVFRVPIPVYDPAACTVAYRSPDGWRVAYESCLGPGPGRVMVLDLDLGEERQVYESAPDGFIDRLSWSPDGKLLAIACGDEREDFVVVEGVDGSALFPSKFTVVDLSGNRVTEVSAGGGTLNTSLAWSPDGSHVAVQTVRPARNADPASPDGEWTVRHGPVYAGRLGEPLARVTAENEDLSALWMISLVADDRLLLTGNHDGQPALSLRDLATGRRCNLDGYGVLRTHDPSSRSESPILLDSGVVLTSVGAGGDSLSLLAADGSVEPLAAMSGEVRWSYLAGRVLTCVEAGSDDEYRAEVIFLPED